MDELKGYSDNDLLIRMKDNCNLSAQFSIFVAGNGSVRMSTLASQLLLQIAEHGKAMDANVLQELSRLVFHDSSSDVQHASFILHLKTLIMFAEFASRHGTFTRNVSSAVKIKKEPAEETNDNNESTNVVVASKTSSDENMKIDEKIRKRVGNEQRLQDHTIVLKKERRESSTSDKLHHSDSSSVAATDLIPSIAHKDTPTHNEHPFITHNTPITPIGNMSTSVLPPTPSPIMNNNYLQSRDQVECVVHPIGLASSFLPHQLLKNETKKDELKVNNHQSTSLKRKMHEHVGAFGSELYDKKCPYCYRVGSLRYLDVHEKNRSFGMLFECKKCRVHSGSGPSYRATDKNEPSDAQVIEKIAEMVKISDLTKISMKQMVLRICQEFTGSKMSIRTGFIKEHIREAVAKLTRDAN